MSRRFGGDTITLGLGPVRSCPSIPGSRRLTSTGTVSPGTAPDHGGTDGVHSIHRLSIQLHQHIAGRQSAAVRASGFNTPPVTTPSRPAGMARYRG